MPESFRIVFLISFFCFMMADGLSAVPWASAQEAPVESSPDTRSPDPIGPQEPPVSKNEKAAEADPAQPPPESGKKPYVDIDQHIRDFADEDEDTAPLPSTGDTAWDRYHKALSRQILNSAEWIDSFFDDERVEAEENRTSIKLRFDTKLEEGEGVDFGFSARIRLALPTLEDRFSLVISGDPDEDIREGTAEDSTGVDPSVDETERTLTAALWYTLVDTYKRNLSMRVGAQWRDGSPVLWAGPRYRQLWTFDPWAARYTWAVRWYTDVGFESRMRLDFERPLTRVLFFRQTTTYDWDQEREVTFKLDDGTKKDKTVTGFNQIGLSFKIFQPLSRLAILEYSTGVSFVDQPETVLNNVSLLVKYRRQVWRDWLFFEVTPSLNFPWIDDYEITPAILFRFEAILGRYR